METVDTKQSFGFRSFILSRLRPCVRSKCMHVYCIYPLTGETVNVDRAEENFPSQMTAWNQNAACGNTGAVFGDTVTSARIMKPSVSFECANSEHAVRLELRGRRFCVQACGTDTFFGNLKGNEETVQTVRISTLSLQITIPAWTKDASPPSALPLLWCQDKRFIAYTRPSRAGWNNRKMQILTLWQETTSYMTITRSSFVINTTKEPSAPVLTDTGIFSLSAVKLSNISTWTMSEHPMRWPTNSTNLFKQLMKF